MMNFRFPWIRLTCLTCIVVSHLWAQPYTAADEPQVAPVRRANPRGDEPLPVESDQVIPGKIYNHFSKQHSRYVWAFAEEGGKFSYPFGPGTTELPENFDLPITKSETEEFLELQAGPWAERSRLQARKILVHLGVDGKWEILRGRGIQSHYDLDSGLRWEWHGQRKVAVLHTNGRQWRYDGKRYVPANPWLLSAAGHLNEGPIANP